jgi:hypothetical protein
VYQWTTVWKSAAALMALTTPVLAEQYHLGMGAVETPSGLARVEGDWRYPSKERLVIGDTTVVEPNPDSAQQAVWIEAEVGTLLLVGLASTGNGCFTEYVWVHTAPEDNLRVSEPFGTCTGDLEISNDSETVTVSMSSMNPDEGRLEYVYDGRRVVERVLGMQEAGFGPEASARNWIGHAPSELFAAAEWREPLIALIGQEAYDEAQDILDLYDGEGMQLSEGWVAGLSFSHRDSGASWGAVAINDDDRRLLVVLGRQGQAPRLWGEARGPLPAPIVEAISRVR